MLPLLCPDLYLPSVFALRPAELSARGIRGLIIDLDNTLIKWGEAASDARLPAWAGALRAEGFSLCIVSNNGGARVLNLATALGIPVVTNAGKPRARAFWRAMQILQTEPADTAMMGDQVFTDVLGAKRLGLFAILVVPLSRHEFIGTRLVRLLERRVLHSLQARGLLAQESEGSPDDSDSGS